MPVMRASRPESKQKVGDALYEQLKAEHGKLAGKLVGMLLEGLPHERLIALVHEPAALEELVSMAAPMLEIQRQELASNAAVTADGLELLAKLVLLASDAAPPPDSAPPSLEVSSISDLCAFPALTARGVCSMQEEVLQRAEEDTSPHRANACWSIADLAMESAWRAQIGQRKALLQTLASLLEEGDAWEKKNAALCFGNLCCDWSLSAL